MRRRDLLGACGASALAACSITEIPDRRRALLQSWGNDFLLARYAETASDAKVLQERARAMTDDPSPERLDATRGAWQSARAPFKRTELFAFGPYTEEPLRLGPQIDFWPARPDSVEAIASGTDALPSAERLGSATKGFPAIEYLLYGTEDPVSDFSASARRGEYLVLLTSDLALQVKAMHDAWDPDHDDFLAELVQAGRTSALYPSLDRALGEIVNRMGFLVENIRHDKLGKPLGDSAGGTPQPSLCESRFSGRSIGDVLDNLSGLEQIYLGLDAYLEERGQHLAHRFHTALAEGRSALHAIPEPLTQALENAPETVRNAIDRLEDLELLIQVDVIHALSLTVGFNDNDGD